MAPEASSISSAQRKRSDRDWMSLMAFVRDRKVVPILGPGLLTVELDGEETDLYTWIARSLAEEMDVRLSGEESGFAALESVARVSGQSHDFHNRLFAVWQDALRQIQEKGRLPEALELLAEVTDFPLIISTTFDTLMLEALKRHRQGVVQHKAYFPGAKPVDDLKPDQPSAEPGTAGEAILYQLFGTAAGSSLDFVTSEREAIEYLSHLMQGEPRRLLSVLDRQHLLFIGCEFPDWFARFFLRLVRNTGTSRELEIFAEPCLLRNGHFPDFLKAYRNQSRLWPDGSPADFVRELHRRWKEEEAGGRRAAAGDAGLTRTAPAPAARAADAGSGQAEPGTVFLSYARQDVEAVKRLKADLEAAGIRCWFDDEKINHGDEWEETIEDSIHRCELFVPLLSKTTVTRREGVFRQEWDIALRLSRRIEPPYIFPAIVDAQRQFDTGVYGKRFQSKDIAHLPEGRVTEKFVRSLREALRKAAGTAV